jgi:hypothetical protein
MSLLGVGLTFGITLFVDQILLRRRRRSRLAVQATGTSRSRPRDHRRVADGRRTLTGV